MNETPDPNAMPGSSPMPAGPPPPPPPGPMGYQAPPPPRKGNNKVGLIILGILGLIVVGGIAYAFLTRDSSPGDAAALQVGDCFDLPSDLSSINDVQHQPCNKEHDAEVFLVFTHPAGSDEAYPVVSGFSDFVQEQCTPAFTSYTGRPAETETELAYGWFQPTLTSWGKGDRGFTCHITRADEQKLSGSVKNLGSAPLP